MIWKKIYLEGLDTTKISPLRVFFSFRSTIDFLKSYIPWVAGYQPQRFQTSGHSHQF